MTTTNSATEYRYSLQSEGSPYAYWFWLPPSVGMQCEQLGDWEFVRLQKRIGDDPWIELTKSSTATSAPLRPDENAHPSIACPAPQERLNRDQALEKLRSLPPFNTSLLAASRLHESEQPPHSLHTRLLDMAHDIEHRMNRQPGQECSSADLIREAADRIDLLERFIHEIEVRTSRILRMLDPENNEQDAREKGELPNKSNPMICDGCNVRSPHEHRCHRDYITVNGERVSGSCECPDCNVSEEELTAFRRTLEAEDHE